LQPTDATVTNSCISFNNRQALGWIPPDWGVRLPVRRSQKKLLTPSELYVAITFSCPNGHRLKVADQLSGKTITCPRCSTASLVPVASPDGNLLDGPALLGSSSLGSLPNLATANAAYSQPGLDAAPLDHSYVPRSVSARRWQPLAVGLKIHYAAAIAFALAAVLFWIGLAIPLLPAIGEDFPILSDLALIGSMICFGCAVLLQIPGTVICFAAPDGQARCLLAGSLVMLAILVPVALRIQPTSTAAQTVSILLAIAAVSWMLWMLFLRRLAVVRGREEVAYDAVRLIGLGLVAAVAAAITLVVLTKIIITVFAFVPHDGMRLGICAALVIVAYTVTRLVEANFGLETSWQALLFPTGLFFVFQYLDHVSSLQALVAKVGNTRDAG
jgi:hypothetical protein